jgi:membrane associated rhomboid family serine protease
MSGQQASRLSERFNEPSGRTAEQVVEDARQAFFVMLGFLGLLWAIQIANWADSYHLDSRFAIVSRDMGRLPDIFVAPLLHLNWDHIESNSGPLFVFGFLAAYRGIRKFLLVTLVVAITSGLAVWLFAHDNVYTVGASGLIFGYFGYVVVRGIFDRHLIDTLVGVVMALCYAYLVSIAVPGAPNGISWLAHLGGLVGGIASGWLFRERARGAAVPRPAGPANLPPGSSSDGSRAALHKELEDLGL